MNVFTVRGESDIKLKKVREREREQECVRVRERKRDRFAKILLPILSAKYMMMIT